MAPSKQTLQNLLNITPTVLYEYLQSQDGNSRFLYISPSSKEILGYPREHLMKDLAHFWEIIHPDDLERMQVDDKTFKDGFYTSEVRILLPSGEVRWIRFRAKQASKTKDGSIIWGGCIVDVTPLKRTMQKLHESEQRYKELTEMLPEAIFESDIDANLTYANQQAFNISGYTKQDLKNGLNGIDLLVPEDRKRAKENLAKRFQGEEIGINEYKALRKDGSIFPVLLHTSPIFEQGTLKGLRGIIVDISQRKQAEEELNKYRNHLEELIVSRTSELKQKTVNLEETNIALKVLLEQRDLDKKDIEKNMINKIEKLVFPYLDKLKERKLDHDEYVYIDIIESNLKEIISHLSPDLFGQFSKLTPTEIQIADMIRMGKATKEIAGLLKLSPTTIATHRQNIRKKLALTNKKMNLRTALSINQ